MPNICIYMDLDIISQYGKNYPAMWFLHKLNPQIIYQGKDQININKKTKTQVLQYYKQKIDKNIEIQFDDYNQHSSLPFFMPSLKKIYFQEKNQEKNDKQYQKWIQNSGKMILQYKYDGVSIMVHVQKDFIRLYTRGNGNCGRDITYLLPFLNIDPISIEKLQNMVEKNNQKGIGIRGEIVIPQKIFDEKYKNKFANQRQLAVQINKKYIKSIEELELLNDLDIIFYQIYSEQQINHEQLKNTDINYIYGEIFESTENICDDQKFLSNFFTEQQKYPIDGIVLTKNEDLNVVSEYQKSGDKPVDKMAIKFQDEAHETTIIQITWQTSRRGKLSPVAILQPVYIENTIIKKVTCHNARIVKQQGLGPGAIVEIVKQGQTIPQIKSVILQTDPQFPKISFFWNESMTDIYVNDSDNDDEISKKILYVLQQYEIKGIGSKTIEQIVKKKKISNIYQFIELDYQDMISLDGVLEKKAANLISQIQKLKKEAMTNPTIFMSSLTLQCGFGQKIFQQILQGVGLSILQLMQLDAQQLEKQLNDVSGFGSIRAVSAIQLIQKLQKQRNHDFFEQLIQQQHQQHHQYKNTQENWNSGKIYGKSFLMTGIRDPQLIQTIHQNNGKIYETFSKKIDILIAAKQSLKGGCQKIKKAIDRDIIIYVIDDGQTNICQEILHYKKAFFFKSLNDILLG